MFQLFISEGAVLAGGNILQSNFHAFHGKRLKTELGTSGSEGLDDTSDIVANENESSNAAMSFLCRVKTLHEVTWNGMR